MVQEYIEELKKAREQWDREVRATFKSLQETIMAVDRAQQGLAMLQHKVA